MRRLDRILISELWEHRNNVDYTQEVIRKMFGECKRRVYTTELSDNMQAYDIYLRDSQMGLSSHVAYRHAMQLRRELTRFHKARPKKFI